MTTEANFPLQLLCLKPALYGRLSLDHLWPLLGDHQGQKGKDLNRFTDDKEKAAVALWAALCGRSEGWDFYCS
jgi:hypothetical protein